MPIFRDSRDYAAFMDRLNKLSEESEMQILAFALIQNHFHMLLHRTVTPLATYMQRLLTGYALFFNKRHERAGHLFQNRYKAIPCSSERHFLELVRYIHLNPVRSGMVDTYEELGRFPYSGHRYLLGRNPHRWFNDRLVLSYFGFEEGASRSSYLSFLAAGLKEASDSRVAVKTGAESASESHVKTKERQSEIWEVPLVTADVESNVQEISTQICDMFALIPEELLGTCGRREVSRARALLAFRMSKELGLTGSDIGRRLSVGRSAVSKMIARGKRFTANGNIGNVRP